MGAAAPRAAAVAKLKESFAGAAAAGFGEEVGALAEGVAVVEDSLEPTDFVEDWASCDTGSEVVEGVVALLVGVEAAVVLSTLDSVALLGSPAGAGADLNSGCARA